MANDVRQQRSAEERQDEIIKAAVDLTGVQGVDKVTTQAIADAARRDPRGALSAFPDQGRDLDRGRPLGHGAADGNRRHGGKQCRRFAERNPAVPRVMFSTNPHLEELLKEILASYERKIAALLANAKTRGLLRLDPQEADAGALRGHDPGPGYARLDTGCEEDAA